MVCRITSINSRGTTAFTLVEIMVATALTLVVATAVLFMSYFSNRSFVALTNYLEMDQASQQGIDNLSKAIRQCQQVTAYSSNAITLLDVNSNVLQFVFDPAARTLSSVSRSQTNVYLSGCDAAQFSIYQRTPISNTFLCSTPAYVTNAKLVQVSWNCSAALLGGSNSECLQSATIVLRNN